MKTVEIIAWGLVAAIVLVIVFVRAPHVSGGESGGSQASRIINSTAQGAATVIRAATGL